MSIAITLGPCVGSKKRITAEIRECALYASGGGSTTGSSGSTASVLEILSVHPCGRFTSSISFQNFHCLFAIFKGCLLSSFQQNWLYFIRTSIAKVSAFPVFKKEFLTFPIWFYNILGLVGIVTTSTTRICRETSYPTRYYKNKWGELKLFFADQKAVSFAIQVRMK